MRISNAEGRMARLSKQQLHLFAKLSKAKETGDEDGQKKYVFHLSETRRAIEKANRTESYF